MPDILMPLSVEEIVENILSTQEAAMILKISVQQVKNLTRAGSVPEAFRASSRIFYLKKDVFDYARAHRIVGNGKDLSRSVDRYIDEDTYKTATVADRRGFADYVTDNYVTIMDAGRKLSISQGTVSYYVTHKKLAPAFESGKVRFFDRRDLESLALAKRA